MIWLIRIKAAKSVDVFGDELVNRSAIRGSRKTKSRPVSRRHRRAQKVVDLLLLAA
jgi:hypothetical protein